MKGAKTHGILRLELGPRDPHEFDLILQAVAEAINKEDDNGTTEQPRSDEGK